MEFPITRRRLQNYRDGEAIFVETEQRIEKVVNRICKDVEHTILTTNEHRYKYNLNMEVFGHLRVNPTLYNYKFRQQPSILNQVLYALRERFLDCYITTDPLNTYILIDWS